MSTKAKAGIGIAVAVVVIAAIAAFFWFTHPYKITYDLAEGTWGDQTAPESYTVSDSVTIPNPERKGYVFAGWEGTGLEDITENVTITQGSTGDRTYKAVWHELVNLKVEKVVINHGDSTVSAASQEVLLSLWGSDEDEQWVPVEEVTITKNSKNMTMTYDKAKKITTFELDKGKSTFRKIEDKYSKFIVTAYSLESGFDTDPAEGYEVDADCAASFNLTFNPQTWTMKMKVVAADKATADLIEDCGVRVDCWNAWKDGTPYEPINQHKLAYLHVNPTLKGTVAKQQLWKWDNESTHAYPDGFQTDPQSYYYSAELFGYKLSNGQKIEATKNGPISAEITVTDGAEDAGDRDAVYLKQGPKQDGTDDYQQGKLTITLKAKTYDVTLKTNGGKIADKYMVTKFTYGYGTDLPTGKVIKKKGYVFDGWYTQNGDNGNWGEKITRIGNTYDSDVTLYARWSEKTYDVVFHTGKKASKVKTQEVAWGQTAKEPAQPTRDGYGFDTWYTDKKHTKVYDFSTKVTHDLDLYAGWSKDPSNDVTKNGTKG